jgi:CheY-like chemotaxis protein
MTPKKEKFKILIVDDERDLRLTIKEVFEIFGWEVHDAENGKKGLEKMMSDRYDFVISDIRMPVATGIDFLKQLPEEMKKSTPIIMMSAYSDYSEKAVQQLGACKLISKPISINDLVREMEAFKAAKGAA